MPKFDTIAPGKTPIASYQPILELGRGGMGTVDLARAVGAGGFERLVVVKRLNRDLLGRAEAVQRFLDEARHAALIHHANVVGIHQIGRDEEGYFLVLDYVEGSSLDGLVDRAAQRRERIPPPIVLRIALDAVAGLHAAHRAEDATGRSLGLLHRDVSLQNVLVGRDGVARIADFGIAKSALAQVVTDHRYMVGKLMYSPPEYLWRRPVGPTLDVYALGVTLWIAFASMDPFPDVDEAQLVTHILNDRIPRLSEVGIRIAPQVDALVAKACDPDPELRYQSAREMGDAIEAIGRETGWLASHAEVAEYVEDLLGPELRERRERIATFVEQKRADSPLHESVAPPAIEPPVMLTTRLAARTASEGTEPIVLSEQPRRGGTLVLAAAGVVLAAASTVWLTRSEQKPAYQPLLATSATASAPAMPVTRAAPVSESSPLPSTPAAERLAIDPTTLPRAASAKTRKPAAPEPKPVAPGPKLVAPAPPAPVVEAPPPAPAPEGPGSGSLIRKNNPYR